MTLGSAPGTVGETPPGRDGTPDGDVCRLGSHQCSRCLITFPDEKFQERHMKREHPADFVAEKLRGVLFVCFTCARPFPSSHALTAHQRRHALSPRGPRCGPPQPPYPCPDCGKGFSKAFNLRRHRAAHCRPPGSASPAPFSCTECGEAFEQEAGLHEHYIRHARGEL
ncbi:zinc finger protein 576 isoform X2 [Tachyglossus aculeatus]|nr:zinc finger protein 576 isoform X2 [Tachyglossus aculeatus]